MANQLDMSAFFSILRLLRTTMVLAVVALLAFGTLIAPMAGAHDHHASVSVDDGMSHDGHDVASCSAGHISDAHDVGDGSCCVGTCTTILGIAPIAHRPAGRISEIEFFDLPVLARAGTVEFLRPPSLTV